MTLEGRCSGRCRTTREWINGLRAHTAAKQTVGVTGLADQLPPYWRSFSEWFADNVARWATSGERPLTLVDRFFKRVVDGLRRLYASAAGKKWLPASEMKEWLDRRAESFLAPEEAIEGKDAERRVRFRLRCRARRDLRERGTEVSLRSEDRSGCAARSG
jgi:hypothetical protein